MGRRRIARTGRASAIAAQSLAPATDERCAFAVQSLAPAADERCAFAATLNAFVASLSASSRFSASSLRMLRPIALMYASFVLSGR